MTTQQAEALLDDFAKRAEGEERKWYNIAQAFRSAEEKIADARMDAEDAAWENRAPTHSIDLVAVIKQIVGMP